MISGNTKEIEVEQLEEARATKQHPFRYSPLSPAFFLVSSLHFLKIPLVLLALSQLSVKNHPFPYPK